MATRPQASTKPLRQTTMHFAIGGIASFIWPIIQTKMIIAWACRCTARALRGYCVLACCAHAMKPGQGGKEKPPCIYVGITRFFISLVVGGHGQAQPTVA